jgi:addiction module HigA family antidote
MKHPPHPGQILREDCLPELGLTIGGAAEALGVSRQTLDKIVNGRGGVTPEMAIRFEKVFGSSAQTWLRMQGAYDLALARAREDEALDRTHGRHDHDVDQAGEQSAAATVPEAGAAVGARAAARR